MKVGIFHSLPEALTYGLLLFVMIVTLAGDIEVLTLISRHSQILAQEKNDTQKIVQDQICIASFYLLPNRTGVTINNIPNCQDVIKQLQQNNTSN